MFWATHTHITVCRANKNDDICLFPFGGYLLYAINPVLLFFLSPEPYFALKVRVKRLVVPKLKSQSKLNLPYLHFSDELAKKLIAFFPRQIELKALREGPFRRRFVTFNL